MDKWNSTVGKKDIVYIIGDFAFGSSNDVRNLLGKLNGKKFLIMGNHDKSSDHSDMTLEYKDGPVKNYDWPYDLRNFFEQITQMKTVTFRKDNYDFLDEDFTVFMCHYAMVVWPSKHYGVVEAHGHSHGRLDDFNEESTDLRVDVGIDGKLADFNLVSLKQLYEYFKEKTKGEKFIHYAAEKKEEKEMLV